MTEKKQIYLLPNKIEFNDLINELDEPFIRKERLRFIDAHLFWTGRLRREDICKQFDLHETNASKDISIYIKLRENNVLYDRKEKMYKATPLFQPVGRKHSLNTLLSYSSLNMQWTGNVPDYLYSLPVIDRQPNLSTIRNLVICAEQRLGIQIKYHSMKNPEGNTRIIFPKHLIFDGLRWHTRAFCMLRKDYRDFVVSRMVLKKNLTTNTNLPDDELWEKIIELKIQPHRKLTPAQQKLVSMDFNMNSGQLNIKVRQPLAYYIVRNLYLDSDLEPPRQLIECPNWQDALL